MPEAIIHLPHLRSLIGLRVRFLGEACIIVEVLDEPPTLVLEPLDSARVIQADAYGHASEMGQDNRLVQVLSPDRLALGNDLLDLELLD
ncbi:MAG: hypothetical protein HXY26_01395 [Hydrogenophilaceae bacterium]|nr:hypothetical protein [Hydrogenophilaceae bacterium]